MTYERAANLSFPLAGIFLCVIAGAITPRLLAYLPSVIGLLTAGWIFWRHRAGLQIERTEILLVAATAGLAALSAIWSPDFFFGLERSGKIALTLIGGILFIAAARSINRLDPRLIWVACTFHAVTAAIITSEYLCNFPVYAALTGVDPTREIVENKLNRSIVVLALTFLPLAFLLWQTFPSPKRIAALIAFTTPLLGSLIFTSSQTAQLSFAVGVICFFSFPVAKNSMWRVTGVAIALLVLASPWLVRGMYAQIPEEIADTGIMIEASIPHRIEIWNFVVDKIWEHPLTGNGVEAMRNLHSETKMKFSHTHNLLHPHNAVLQVWLEFGLVGIMIGMGWIGWFLQCAQQTAFPVRRLYISALLMSLCASVTGYGLWQGWQLGLFFLLAALCICARKSITR